MKSSTQPLRVGAVASVVIALFMVSLSVRADEGELPTGDDGGQSHFGLGVGVGVSQKPYQGVKNEIKPIPLITYENSWVRVQGTGIEGKIAKAGDFSFTLKGTMGLRDGYKSSDSDIFDGMDTRKGSFWVGPTVSWKNPLGTLSAEFLGDASAYSKGQQGRLSFSKPFKVGNLGIVPRIGLQWQSNKYVNYYYGVQASEATSWRTEYQGKATTNLNTGIHFKYNLTPKQSLTADVGLVNYGSGIKDSPLVDKNTTFSGLLGYAYAF